MTRLAAAWRALEREQRYAALGALGLFLSMFLHWYSKTETRVEHGATLRPVQISLTAFQDFSFVELAVLLVSAGLLVMLFARGERRRFQLPGGDGLIVMVAGGWTALLIFYRLLDKPGVLSNHRSTAAATIGVEWGIFIALLVALALLYTGVRMRAVEQTAHTSSQDPAPPNEDSAAAERHAAADDATGYAADEPPAAGAVQVRSGPQTAASVLGEAPRRRPRYPPAPGEQQMSLDDAPTDSA